MTTPRVALIAVHGVADQQPGETARAVVDLLVSSAPDGTCYTSASTQALSRDLRSLVDVERDHILQVLAACQGSQAEAARILGIGRNTLWRKLRHYAVTA